MSNKPVIVIVDASVDVTGALVAAHREAKLLTDAAEFVLVLPKHTRVPESLLEGFSEVLKLPMPQIRRHLPSIVAYLPALLFTSVRLFQKIRQRKCGRVQINDFYLLHGMVLRLLGYRGQIVTWVRIDPKRFGIFGTLWIAAARWSSNAIVAVSKFIERRIPYQDGVTLLYEPRAPEISGWWMAGQPRRLVYVGNFMRGKGQDQALAAFERIRMRFPDSRLIFVGSDMGLQKNRAYRAELEHQAALGVAAAQIEFFGPASDVGRFYRGAYAALNFSASESFSLTCQDASAFGLPVIATRCGGPEEIIEDDITGFLVPVGDVEATADRMERLLADPTKAAEMGQRGADLIGDRFPLERFSVGIKRLLNLS